MPPGRREAALAAAAAAATMLIVALVSGALAVVAPDPAQIAVRGAAAWAAALAGLVLMLSARRGGDQGIAFAADVLAALLVAAQLAAGGPHAEVLLGALVVPLLHAALFQPPGRVAGLAAGGLAAAAAGSAVGGTGTVDGLLWALPGALAAALASLPVSALREQRRSLERTGAEARRLADEDGLTGVANYRAFWRTLQSEAARAQRHDQPFSVIVLDLDDFKRVNDDHGHLVGDAALRAVAAALRRAVRAEDLVCRQGGDEFAVVAVAAGAAEAPRLARRLVAAVSEGAPVPPVPFPLSASAGWATFGEPARSAQALVEQAETGLRQAKHRREQVPERRAPDAARSAGASALRVSGGSPPAVRPGLRLAVLGNLARALTGATTERGIAETAVAHAAGAVDAERVAIVRRARAGGSLALVAVSGGRAPREALTPEAAPPLATALAERRSVLLPRGEGGADREGGTLAVPLIAGEEVWGALQLDSRRDPAFTPDDIRLLEAMAETVGRSLSVAQVLAELAGSRWQNQEDYEQASRRADGHGREVARLAEQVGRRLGLAGVHLRQLYLAALFHDIGTVCAPPAVLRKEGQLTDEEFAALRPHPLVGQRMLGDLPGLSPVADIVRAARERWDGGGYPDGLAGEEIPLPARILHACDAYVAMTTSRPYRPSLSPLVALEELRRNSAAQFDPAVVEALIDSVGAPADADADADAGAGAGAGAGASAGAGGR